MKWQTITEGKAQLRVPIGKITADLPVFYNPVMRMNRDSTLQVLAAWDRKKLRIADPLAGSGVRIIRMLKELPKSAIASVMMNDGSPAACKNIAKNFTLSKLSKAKTALANAEANQFLHSIDACDYIDIDPFGSPNPFLDAAVQNLTRGGILALTATDTSALSGSHPAACRRKYWAAPLKNEFMHETGARILIRKAQLIAAQYDRSLIPVLTYADAHYTRVFLMHVRGNPDPILHQHAFLRFCPKCGSWDTAKRNSGICCEREMQIAGPLWGGPLWDVAFLKPQKLMLGQETLKLLELLRQEATLQSPGFFDLHKLSKRHKIPLKPLGDVRAALTAAGHKTARTHFSGTAIRSDASLAAVLRAMR